MAIEVFNRYEYKYIISSDIAKELFKRFQNTLILDEFCKKNSKYKIINHYIDTKNYQLIRDSLDKPIYKHKLRIRTYKKITNPNDFVFFEIKKKYKGLVNKRRCQLTYKEALTMMTTKQLPEIRDYMNEQVLKEILYILKQDEYELKSKIVYDRIAFFSKDKKLRISFDFKIHSDKIKHLEKNQLLMEIKTPDSIPIWLVDVLNELCIKSSSFSKYGIDFQNKIQEGELCQQI